MQFEVSVLSFIKDNDSRKRELADHFEVAETTVDRWANGAACPHPRIQALVLEFIRNYTTGNHVHCEECNDPDYAPPSPAALKALEAGIESAKTGVRITRTDMSDIFGDDDLPF